MVPKKSQQFSAFSFVVKLGDSEGAFQEVSGLSTNQENKDVTVTLKKGIAPPNSEFTLMHDLAGSDPVKTYTAIIVLSGENGEPAMKWILKNAWIVKISLSGFTPNDDLVAVESLVLAYGSIIMGN